MPEDIYQRVFHEYTKSLDQAFLGRLCMENGIIVPHFLYWIKSDKVRQAKMTEVTESRIMAIEKAKQ